MLTPSTAGLGQIYVHAYAGINSNCFNIFQRQQRGIGTSSPPVRSGYGSTVFINITLYADHSDRLKYSSLPVDQGWRNGA